MADQLQVTPSLDKLLAKRGIVKDRTFNDYQGYIAEQEKTIRPRLFGRGLLTEGSMHLAMRRIIVTRNFLKRYVWR